jgi:hypothetical protein
MPDADGAPSSARQLIQAGAHFGRPEVDFEAQIHPGEPLAYTVEGSTLKAKVGRTKIYEALRTGELRARKISRRARPHAEGTDDREAGSQGLSTSVALQCRCLAHRLRVGFASGSSKARQLSGSLGNAVAVKVTSAKV